ncbi:MAG: ABC transporter permease [Clostridia bacterium]|nr:ABC transporter permease [Clostridia bacterium]
MMASLRHSARVAWAVAGQRWRQSLRYPMNFVTNSVFQPLSWLAPVYFLGRAFANGSHVPGLAAYSGSGDFTTFFLVGAIVGGLMSSVMWGMGFALKQQMDQGVLEANWLTPSSRFAQLVGISLFDFTYTIAQFIVTLGLAAWLFGFHPTGSFWLGLGFLVPVALGLYGFGFGLAGVVLLMREANMVIDTSSFLLGVLSGENFPVVVLPPALLAVSLALPTTYAIDGLRGILMGTRTLMPISWEFGALCVLAVVLLFVGRWMFLFMERFCRQRGTLALR